MLAFLSRYADWLHLQWPSGDVSTLPRVDDHYRTNVAGVYVVGDLAGVPLLKFSLDSGTKAVRHIAETQPTPSSNADDADYDVVILGAGASGMAAAREAEAQGLSYVVLEANERFATIKDFQAGKPIYTYPESMTPAGSVQVSAPVKEELVDELTAQTDDIPVRDVEAHRIERNGDLLTVLGTEGTRIHGRNVVVAIGRSGSFRTLDVPGEEHDHVHHRLHDPTKHADSDVVVIGGGDSALEAAIGLVEAGAHVTLSYRRDAFVRPKQANIDRAYELASYASEGSLRLRLQTNATRIDDDTVTLRHEETGETETVPAQHVFAMIGREAPLDFFRRSGIELRNDWGSLPNSVTELTSGLDWLTQLNWRRIGAFAAFFLFMCAVYSWKDGGWLNRLAQSADLFPFTLTAQAGATGLWDILMTSATKPGFYYTLAYSAIVVAGATNVVEAGVATKLVGAGAHCVQPVAAT